VKKDAEGKEPYDKTTSTGDRRRAGGNGMSDMTPEYRAISVD
jgi:hypothetical protein